MLALAATAGVAIENARLFEQAEQRQRWLQASMEITTQLLSVDGDEPLELIARQAREIADADIVTVVLPMPDSDRLMVEVAAAREEVQLAGYQFTAENTYRRKNGTRTCRQCARDRAAAKTTPLKPTTQFPAPTLRKAA